MKILEGAGSLPCPECGGKAKADRTWPAEVNGHRAIYRDRRCLQCDLRWHTLEVDAALVELLFEDAT